MRTETRRVQTKHGLLVIHAMELDQGWVAQVDHQHDVPVRDLPSGSPLPQSADEAVSRLVAAVERS